MIKDKTCRKSDLEKLSSIQLPNYFKRLGFVISICAIILLIINKMSFESVLFKSVLKQIVLIGLLLVSISKEKFEDERIINIRMRSFMIAFLLGVLFALLLPIIDYLVDIVRDIPGEIKSSGDFVILWQLLTLQILSFEMLKRKNA